MTLTHKQDTFTYSTGHLAHSNRTQYRTPFTQYRTLTRSTGQVAHIMTPYPQLHSTGARLHIAQDTNSQAGHLDSNRTSFTQHMTLTHRAGHLHLQHRTPCPQQQDTVQDTFHAVQDTNSQYRTHIEQDTNSQHRAPSQQQDTFQTAHDTRHLTHSRKHHTHSTVHSRRHQLRAQDTKQDTLRTAQETPTGLTPTGHSHGYFIPTHIGHLTLTIKTRKLSLAQAHIIGHSQ